MKLRKELGGAIYECPCWLKVCGQGFLVWLAKMALHVQSLEPSEDHKSLWKDEHEENKWNRAHPTSRCAQLRGGLGKIRGNTNSTAVILVTESFGYLKGLYNTNPKRLGRGGELIRWLTNETRCVSPHTHLVQDQMQVFFSSIFDFNKKLSTIWRLEEKCEGSGRCCPTGAH